MSARLLTDGQVHHRVTLTVVVVVCGQRPPQPRLSHAFNDALPPRNPVDAAPSPSNTTTPVNPQSQSVDRG